MDSKACTKCGEVKLVSAFSLNYGKPRHACKTCSARQQKEWFDVNGKEVNRKRADAKRAWVKDNPEKVKLSAASFRKKHRDELNSKKRGLYQAVYAERWRSYREANRESILASGAAYRAANKDKIAARIKSHYQNNKGDYIMRARAREQHIATRATPAWADKKEINNIYSRCPDGHHVDHVIPLAGKFVSGLHVPQNLQYLPARENLAKRNHYEVA